MFCEVNKHLRPFLLLIVGIGVLTFGVRVSGDIASAASDIRERERIPQSTQKPKYDYMSTFLSRNTNPLGLKENPELNKYLSQASIKWAVRSIERHLLN